MMKLWLQIVCTICIFLTHLMTLIWQIENNDAECETLDIFVAILLGISVVLAWSFVWGWNIWN